MIANGPSFTDKAVQCCPFPLIKKLHKEAPVYLDHGSGMYYVSRYEDIAFIVENPNIFSNQTEMFFGGGGDQAGKDEIQRIYATDGWERMHTLATNDPPSHTRYRALVEKIFTASFVRSLEDYITQLCDDQIDGFLSQGIADLYTDYCVKVPLFLIADQLGVPREGWDRFKIWADAQVALVNPVNNAQERLRLARLNIQMQQYLAGKQKDYHACPDNKLLSNLANVEIDGVKLTTREFVNMGQTFLVAGHETTSSTIAWAINALIRDPDLIQRLRADSSLVSKLVEEIVRLHAASPHVYRRATQVVEIGGVTIPEGAQLMISYLAGNRDERHYACPDQIDLDRKGLRQHLGFGRGIHYCIGNLLARAEVRIAIQRLLTHLDHIRFDPNYPEPRIEAIFHVHRLDGLHIAFDVAEARS